jgi:DNA-binding CsgD family transcriptional regulator
MIGSDANWLAVVDAIQSAGVGAQTWDSALEGFAAATGSRSAQLAGLDASAAVFLNVFTNVDPVLQTVFPATTGINPRIKAANNLPVLKTVTDFDFITPSACRVDPFYQEVLRPYDIPYICMTTVERSQGTFFGLCAVRSHREGPISERQKEIFASLAPHIRSAVRSQIALQGQGAAIVSATMDALSIPVFLCDHYGGVKSHTQAAQLLLQANRGLLLIAGRLSAHHPSEAKTLTEAVAASTARLLRPGPPTSRTVVVHGEVHTNPLVLDVFPLPAGAHQFSFEPCALVVARGPHVSAARRAAVLSTLYALTPAEIEIAQALADGKSANDMADARAVSVGTVRAQLKTIMAKLGVSRQVEVLKRLSQL